MNYRKPIKLNLPETTTNISVSNLNFKNVEKESSKKEGTFAGGNVDEFLLNAVLNKDPYIDVIIDAFKKFSAPIIKKSYFERTVTKKISKLPEEIKDKNLLPFITAYNFKGNNLPENISADLKVKNFSKYLDDNFDALRVIDVEKFCDWLNFDLNLKVEKIITKIFKNERELMIIYERSKGKTLEEVGKIFSLTRERVHQIEAKTVRKFLRSGIQKIFVFIYALSGGKKVITLDDLEEIIDREYAKILWCFMPKMNFYYDKDIDAIIFSRSKESQIFSAYELTEFLPDIMEENIFFETVKNLAAEKKYPGELLLKKFLQVYKQSGKFFHKSGLTLFFKYDYILKERFPSGYKIGNEIDCKKFLRCLKEFFGDEKYYSQRTIYANVRKIGVLCDRGKYIHPDFVHVSSEIV